MKRTKSLHGSGAGALTPASADTPVPPKPTPDLVVEEVLFRSYLREKSRADRLMAEVLELRWKVRRGRMLSITHAMRKRFKPSHLDRPAKKGRGL